MRTVREGRRKEGDHSSTQYSIPMCGIRLDLGYMLCFVRTSMVYCIQCICVHSR